MRYGPSAYGGASFGFGRPWTPAVRALILACVGVYVAQLLLGRSLGLVELLALDTARPLEVWRWASYAFLHGGPLHLLFNMVAIWMFGSEVEERLGTPRFVLYCAATGGGAALSVVLVDTLLVFFVLPVSLKAKHFVVVFGAVELLFGMAGGDRVAHFAHLGGMLFGWLFLRAPAGPPVRSSRGPGLIDRLRQRLEVFTRARDDRRMDALLQKVNDRGIAALSDGEKKFLQRMSRRKRWN